MEYDVRQMFVELEEDDISGFVIIETHPERGYRMAEKWEGAPELNNKWQNYWLPEEQLMERLEQGQAKEAKVVSEKQYRGLLNLAGLADQIPVEA